MSICTMKQKGYQVDQILNELRESVKNDKILSDNSGRDFIKTVANELSSQLGDLVRYLSNKLPDKIYLMWFQNP